MGKLTRKVNPLAGLTSGKKQNMKGPRGLAAPTLALLLVLSVLGDGGARSAPQRPVERRNWTPQAMLYLKGAQGRRFLSDQSRRKDLPDRLPPERRNPSPPLLPLPETAALLLALLQKPQEAREEEFGQSSFLEDSLLNW